jgi:hypothetical protein
MKINQIKQAIAGTPKGANVKLTLERPVRLKKAYEGLPLFKRTTMTVRIGVNNDTRLATVEARENGSRPAVNQGLKGMEWVDAPTLLVSINNPNQFYLRCEPSSNKDERTKPTFVMVEAGIETVVEKADYEHMMLASEKQPSRPYDGCFNTKIENVKRLHTFVESEIEAEDEAEDEAEGEAI